MEAFVKPPASFEIRRLLIRRPRQDDAVAIFERYASDREVTRYVGWPRHLSVETTKAFVASSDDEWLRWPAGPYLVLLRDDHRLIGGTGLGFEAPDRASMGYVLARDAWGHGYATEALQAMVDIAPGLGVRRLYAICHALHSASARVLEKCGFEREGILRRYLEFPNLTPPEWADVLCYSRIFEP